jgi:hypothetical protein
MNPRENAIHQAINDFKSGVLSSQNAAADAYGVARSTLQERLKGRKNARESHAHQQRLTPEQEDFLVEWILEEDQRGYPPSHPRARQMAVRVLRMNGDTNPLGKKWLKGFIGRNPRVASVIGRKIEAVRVEGTTQEALQEFFTRFEEVQKKFRILLENTWNMDEHGIALGMCVNSQVLASSHKKRTYTKSPEDREWVSMVETVSATGRKTRNLAIFRGQYLQSNWFPHSNIPDWYYTTSENGWTSNNIALEWLERIFLVETVPKNSIGRILILDGHGSHLSVDFLFTCKMNNIHLIFLPAHSSHVLQPLDLSCFSPIKSRYRQQIAELASLDDSAPIKKHRFIEYYHRAREESLTERVIRAGWKASGISPFNPEKAYASSQVKGKPITPPRPKHVQIPLDPLLSTPKRPQDVYYATKGLCGGGSLPRVERTILAKAGKAIGQLNCTNALLQQENLALKRKLEDLEHKTKRQRVAKDPNKLFADIREVKAAIDRAAEQKARLEARKPEEEAKKAAEAAAKASFQELCSEWQIEF